MLKFQIDRACFDGAEARQTLVLVTIASDSNAHSVTTNIGLKIATFGVVWVNIPTKAELSNVKHCSNKVMTRVIFRVNVTL